MATLDQTIDIQPTTPNPDFEPEEEWKISLRQQIEDTLKPEAEKLKRELTEKLKDLSPSEASKAQADYDNTMAEIRRTANEQYRQLLARERQERRWAAGERVDERWAEVLMKEQQALLDNYKNAMGGRSLEARGTVSPHHRLTILPHREWKLSTRQSISNLQPRIPKSLRVSLCYNRSDNPLYRGGYADVLSSTCVEAPAERGFAGCLPFALADNRFLGAGRAASEGSPCSSPALSGRFDERSPSTLAVAFALPFLRDSYLALHWITCVSIRGGEA